MAMEQTNKVRARRTSGWDKRRLAGARVLVVEDEVVIAMELQSVVEDAGGDVIGPAHTLDAAVDQTRQAP